MSNIRFFCRVLESPDKTADELKKEIKSMGLLTSTLTLFVLFECTGSGSGEGQQLPNYCQILLAVTRIVIAMTTSGQPEFLFTLELLKVEIT
jgi:hypothetical protein